MGNFVYQIKNIQFRKYVSLCTFFFTIFFLFFLYKENIFSYKYLSIFIIVMILCLCLFFIKNKYKWITLGFTIIVFFLFVIEGLAFYKIYKTLNIIEKNIDRKEQTNIYYVIVRKDSKINSIKDITGKVVYAIEKNKELEKTLKEKVNVQIDYGYTVNDLFYSILEDDETIFLANSGYYEGLIDSDHSFESKVKIIDTIKIKEKIEKISVKENVTEKPFLVYISAIDTRLNIMPKNCLSDVNILMAVNPKKHQILLVNIPRDMYIDIPGEDGMKDKLTHAGMNGGINLSIETIENFMNMDLSYYIRVNFNALKNLVDAVGGIDIYSDVDYTIRTYHDKSCFITPGKNTYNGRCAVAFARERVGYETSDRHRAENEEQMIEKLIQKISSSKVILMNFDQIITSLDGSFETNFMMDEITSMIKIQLNDMSIWNINKYNISGTPYMLPTYSFPNKNLYVVKPDMNTVEEAIYKLNEVLK